MDWRELLRNRWMLAGVGVAAAAGGYVWWKRRQAGGGGASSSTPAAAATGYAGGPGSFDSTGTDVASWLGSQEGTLAAQMSEFLEEVRSSGGVGQIPTGTTGTGTSTSPATIPPASSAGYVTVAKWSSTNAPWNSTLSGIAKHEGTTVSQLLKLNPSIKNANVIGTGQRIRVR